MFRLQFAGLTLGVFSRTLFICPLVVISALGQAPATSHHFSGRLLVQRTEAAKETDVLNAVAKSGASVAKRIPQLGVYVLSLPESALQAIKRKLENTIAFTYVETDEIGKGAAVPNDSLFGSQWHLGAINAIAAWDITVGSTTAPIAMVDSGVNPLHPDLASKLVPGWSFLLSNTNTADVLGHGTATAGTAAAASNNGVGVSGVAWLNPIMPLVVLDASDSATYSDIANAITYAADHGVRIINVSIGGSSPSSTLQNAINYAWNKGAVVFASAMNNSTSTPYYPAACDHVIAVSATEPGDTLASFSNYGSWIDLAAPGDNILTTDNTGGYSNWYGTSFSSPIAAATGALALSINPTLTAQGLVDLLERNSDDIGTPGFDQNFGWGRINAYRVAVAATASLSGDTVPPTVTLLTPASNSQVAGTVQITGVASDNVAVTRVEVWIDGQLGSACSSIAFTCSWNSTAVASGNHTITVKAYDAAGNSGMASETLTTIPPPIAVDTIPPIVRILNPLNNTFVSGAVALTALATDNVGVAQLSFFIDGVLAKTLTIAPWTYSWNSRKSTSGIHTITAKTWDAAGNMGSASSTVSVK